MQFTYLWFLQSVFEWVYDKILTPVFNWMKDLLSSLFSWLYSNVLYPLLEATVFKFAKWVWSLIAEAVFTVIYFIYAQLLSLVDLLYDMFDSLSGLADVTYDGKSMSLIEALFNMKSVTNLFWLINFMGLTLALILAIYAVGKSAMDLDFENRRPVGRVLSATFKCFVQLFTVQISIMFLLMLSQRILKVLNTAVMTANNTTAPKLGCVMFAVTSLTAAKSSSLNLPAETASLTSGVRGKYYTGEYSYTDVSTVKEYFDVTKFDYLVGLLLTLFLLVILFVCLLVFCQRMFDMLTLYVVSPLFIATIPLDDGEKFKKWREMFLGKTFSGFGLLFAMKFYIMLTPLIMDGRLTFTNSKEFDYLTKLVFLAGGALAVMKSGSMVTNILSVVAARAEERTSMTGQRIGEVVVGKSAKLTGRLAATATLKSAKFAGATAKFTGKTMFHLATGNFRGVSRDFGSLFCANSFARKLAMRKAMQNSMRDASQGLVLPQGGSGGGSMPNGPVAFYGPGVERAFGTMSGSGTNPNAADIPGAEKGKAPLGGLGTGTNGSNAANIPGLAKNGGTGTFSTTGLNGSAGAGTSGAATGFGTSGTGGQGSQAGGSLSVQEMLEALDLDGGSGQSFGQEAGQIPGSYGTFFGGRGFTTAPMGQTPKLYTGGGSNGVTFTTRTFQIPGGAYSPNQFSGGLTGGNPVYSSTTSYGFSNDGNGNMGGYMSYQDSAGANVQKTYGDSAMAQAASDAAKTIGQNQPVTTNRVVKVIPASVPGRAKDDSEISVRPRYVSGLLHSIPIYNMSNNGANGTKK